jgi:hypothetical protein
MPIKQSAIRLRSIQIFLSRAFNVYDEYAHILDKEYSEEEWNEYGEAEHDHALDVLLDYQGIVTRAALGELNALVEYELKWIAESILHKRDLKSHKDSKRLSRGKARRIIEEEYNISLRDLPGFPEIDRIRKIANAYKHDDGFSGEYEPFFIGYVEKRYELDPDEAMKYIDAVGEFLHALPGELSNLEDVRVRDRKSSRNDRG